MPVIPGDNDKGRRRNSSLQASRPQWLTMPIEMKEKLAQGKAEAEEKKADKASSQHHQANLGPVSAFGIDSPSLADMRTGHGRKSGRACEQGGAQETSGGAQQVRDHICVLSICSFGQSRGHLFTLPIPAFPSVFQAPALDDLDQFLSCKFCTEQLLFLHIIPELLGQIRLDRSWVKTDAHCIIACACSEKVVE